MDASGGLPQKTTEIPHDTTAKRARRAPPRLRTKTGCLTCRTRRKKCDEKRTVCGGCSRNRLHCKWPESSVKSPARSSAVSVIECTSPFVKVDKTFLTSDASERTANKEDAYKIPRQDLNFLGAFAGNPSTVNTPDTYKLFQYFMNIFVPPLIRSGAHRGYYNHCYIISMGLYIPPLMNSYFACAALQLSYRHADLLPKALKYYSSAVLQTRRMIAAGELHGTEDWPVAMAIFLCLFERWQSGPSKAIIHLQGAGQLLALRKARLGEQQLVTPFHRLYAESVLYNTTISTLLSDDIPSHNQVWSQISTYLSVSPFPDATWEANSPILGVAPDMYRLILEISCFARCEKLNPDQLARVEQIRGDLEAWLPAGEELETQEFWERDVGHRSATLYAVSGDVLLFKMLHPAENDNDSALQNRVHQGLDILQRAGPDEIESHIACWPILVLGCATIHEADFRYLLAKLDDTWQKSYLGDTRRAADVLKAVWAKRAESCGPLGFGADVFMQKHHIADIV